MGELARIDCTLAVRFLCRAIVLDVQGSTFFSFCNSVNGGVAEVFALPLSGRCRGRSGDISTLSRRCVESWAMEFAVQSLFRWRAGPLAKQRFHPFNQRPGLRSTGGLIRVGQQD